VTGNCIKATLWQPTAGSKQWNELAARVKYAFVWDSANPSEARLWLFGIAIKPAYFVEQKKIGDAQRPPHQKSRSIDPPGQNVARIEFISRSASE
jgi:hypothetical protein